MLWLSLVFPQLALESSPGLIEAAEPWALEAQAQVLACNPAAQHLGVRAHQSVSAALALAPTLRCLAFKRHALDAALQALAEVALGFSAEVSLEPPQSLLVEIGASLRYFGGLHILLQQVHAVFHARGNLHQWAVAPTPLAALWCARHQSGGIVLPDQSLADALAHLPVSVLALPPRNEQALLGVGLAQVGQCLAMSARALAQRHGLDLLSQLDRALGRSPDPRLAFRATDTFSRTVELPFPVSELSRCLPLLAALLPDLLVWARRHGQLLTRLGVDILHERQPATPVVVGFSGTRRIEHLQLVLETRMQQVLLPHPVAGFRLQVLASVCSDEPEAGLLPAAPVRLREGRELMERLRARLGAEAVQGLALHHDHRPEQAWRYADPGVPAGGLNAEQPAIMRAAPRPVWLLEVPKPLGFARQPVLRHPLQLLSGPERIESGWWDGADIARDYFVAAEAQGAQYWVFRDCRGQQGWYLHGVFA